MRIYIKSRNITAERLVQRAGRREQWRNMSAIERLIVLGITTVLVIGLLVLSVLGSHARSTNSQVTYQVTAQPGQHLSIGYGTPFMYHGLLRLKYYDVTMPSTGVWSMTTAASPSETLSALPAAGVMPVSDTPGYSCTVTVDGVMVATDSEPTEFRCLTSTNPRYSR